MARPRRPSDLDTTAKFWWSVEDLSVRWHITPEYVRRLLIPHKGACHMARRGRNWRLTLWIPVDVVAKLDKERRAVQRPAAQG